MASRLSELLSFCLGFLDVFLVSWSYCITVSLKAFAWYFDSCVWCSLSSYCNSSHSLGVCVCVCVRACVRACVCVCEGGRERETETETETERQRETDRQTDRQIYRR